MSKTPLSTVAMAEDDARSESSEAAKPTEPTKYLVGFDAGFLPMPQLPFTVPEVSERFSGDIPYPRPYQPWRAPFDFDIDTDEEDEAEAEAEAEEGEGKEAKDEDAAAAAAAAAIANQASNNAAAPAALPAAAPAAPPGPVAPAPALAPTMVNNRYQCGICGNSYAAKNTYDRHMEKENGVRYQCAIAGCTARPFSRYDSLPRHTQAKHPGQTVASRIVQA